MTGDGRDAVDPAIAYLDDNFRDVGVLKIGDRNLMLSDVLGAVGAGPQRAPPIAAIGRIAIAA